MTLYACKKRSLNQEKVFYFQDIMLLGVIE